MTIFGLSVEPVMYPWCFPNWECVCVCACVLLNKRETFTIVHVHVVYELVRRTLDPFAFLSRERLQCEIFITNIYARGHICSS